MTLFDPGLQPERTDLAWRRTVLALLLGSLVALRLLPALFDDAWWVLAGVAGVAGSMVLWLRARRRYRETTDRLARDGDHARLPDARLLAGMAVLVLAGGAAALAIVIGVTVS